MKKSSLEGGKCMSDQPTVPHVLTTAKIGDFTFYIYAYRALTPEECQQIVIEYRQQRNVRKLPSNGSCTVFSELGLAQAQEEGQSQP